MKKEREEFSERLMKQAIRWMEDIYKTLNDPTALNVILYVIKNPRCKKDDIVRDLRNYDVSSVEEAYKSLTSYSLSTIFPILRENEDGTVEFESSASHFLRSFAGMYEAFGKKQEEEILNKLISEGSIVPVDLESRIMFEKLTKEKKTRIITEVATHLYKMLRKAMLGRRVEIETTLQEIGRYLRWMPKEQEIEILKENAEAVLSHLSNLERILYSAVEDVYGELPFSISEYTPIEELRKRFSLDESRFLWDIELRLDAINMLLKLKESKLEEYDCKVILEVAGNIMYDVYGMRDFPRVIEIAEKKTDEFIERVKRVIEGKHYFTPEEWSSKNMREKIRQKLLRPEYSKNAKTLAHKLLENSDKIKKEMVEIAKIQKKAYNTLPVGTLF